MKAKLRIVHENGMYVGYALKNDEVVYKTVPYKDSISCSRDLAKNADKHQTPIKTAPTAQPTTTPVVQSKPILPQVKPKRSCCGRG